jgi:hypothetical protein
MLEPGVEEVVAATYAECAGFGGSGEGDLLYLAGEFWRWPFICIRDEDPRMLELDGGESGVAVSCVVVEGSGVDVSASWSGSRRRGCRRTMRRWRDSLGDRAVRCA